MLPIDEDEENVHTVAMLRSNGTTKHRGGSPASFVAPAQYNKEIMLQENVYEETDQYEQWMY